MLLGGLLWLRRRQKVLAHEGYGTGHFNEPSQVDKSRMPPLWVALAPIVAVIGATSITALHSLWAMIATMFIACLAVIALNWRRFANLNSSMSGGAISSLLPTFNTGSEVGYGVTIASLAAFTLIKSAFVNITPGHPLISASLAVNVLAGVTGSASGGMSIALAVISVTVLLSIFGT